jgi:hypothetical protein
VGRQCQLCSRQSAFLSPNRHHATIAFLSVQAQRSVFVDYIMEHLRPRARAVNFPEGILFRARLQQGCGQDGGRRLLWAVVSLPSGVFTPTGCEDLDLSSTAQSQTHRRNPFREGGRRRFDLAARESRPKTTTCQGRGERAQHFKQPTGSCGRRGETNCFCWLTRYSAG